MRVKILIPFHKNQEQLDKCQQALKASFFQDFEILVNDDSIEEKGFTASVNKLIKEAFVGTYPEYLVILNQDCYLKPEALTNMVAFMDRKPKCFSAGVKQLSSENPDQIIHGGVKECFPGGVHEGGLVSQGACNKEKRVPWVNGACFIVRAPMLLSVGIMDPNYKMFGSDSDWAYTARQRGYECWYIPSAVCVHEQGASKNMDDRTQKVFEKDMSYFRDKWIIGEEYRDLSLELF